MYSSRSLLAYFLQVGNTITSAAGSRLLLVCSTKAYFTPCQAVSNIGSCVTLFSITASRQKEKGTWATSFGESWAGGDENFDVASNKDLAVVGEGEEGGVHPQEVDGLDAADGTAAELQLKPS